MSSELNQYLQKHGNASCETVECAEGGFICTIKCHDGRVIACPGSSKKKAKELAIEEWQELPKKSKKVKPVAPQSKTPPPGDDDEKVAPPTINLDEVSDDSDNVTSSEQTGDDEEGDVDDEILDRLETLETMLKDVLAKLADLPEELRRVKNDLKDDNRRQCSDFVDELRRTCPRGGKGGKGGSAGQCGQDGK